MTPEEAREALHEFAGTERMSDYDIAMFDGQLDNYAHALAEHIRAKIVDPNPLASIFSAFAGTLAADLIDPEKD